MSFLSTFSLEPGRGIGKSKCSSIAFTNFTGLKKNPMYNIKVLRRAIVPAGATVASMFTVSAAKKAPPPPPKDCDPNKPLVRPRDLPIYSSDPPCLTEPPASSQEPNVVLDVISVGRKELEASIIQLEKVKEFFWHTMRTGKAHTEMSLQQLRAEENAMMRYGAIAGGGLVGLLLSLRKGKFKKLVYVSTSSLAMAALCYPQEASVYSTDVIRLTKRYASIGYHLVVGVLNDMGVPIPKVSNPVDYLQQLLGLNETIEGPGSSVLLPPTQETPSHLVQLPSSSSSGSSSSSSSPSK